jgi:hypothetical protein
MAPVQSFIHLDRTTLVWMCVEQCVYHVINSKDLPSYSSGNTSAGESGGRNVWTVEEEGGEP